MVSSDQQKFERRIKRYETEAKRIGCELKDYEMYKLNEKNEIITTFTYIFLNDLIMIGIGIILCFTYLVSINLI